MYCDSKSRVKKSVCRLCRQKINTKQYTSEELELLELYHEGYQVEIIDPPPIVCYGEDLPLPEGLVMYPDKDLFPKYKGERTKTGYKITKKQKMLATTVPHLTLAGAAVAGFPIGVLSTHLKNCMDGVRCRAGQIPNMTVTGDDGETELIFVEPNPEVFQRALHLFMELRTTFDVQGQIEQMPDSEWLKTQRRLADLTKALEANKCNKLPAMINAAFGKSEKFLMTTQSKVDPMARIRKKEAKLRLIQGYPDEWLAYVGPYVKTVQHRVEEMFHPKSSLFYAGAAKPEELNDWLREVQALRDTHFFVCIDYSMFDSTHSEYSFEFVEQLYYALVDPIDREDKRMFQALYEMRHPAGILAGKIKYKAGKVMNGSGRPDTSLLNIVNSMFCLMMTITAVLFDTEPSQVTVSQVRASLDIVKVIASGDDSVCVIPKCFGGVQIPQARVEKQMSQHISQFGFIAKVEPKPNFTHMVFLGCRPYPVQGEWYWGPTIGRRIVKHHFLHHCTQDPVAVLNGITDMEVVCYNHVPILSDLARRSAKLMEKQKFTPFAEKDSMHKVKWVDYVDQSKKARDLGLEKRCKTPRYDDGTLRHLAEVYSVSMEDLEDLIAYMQEIPSLPIVLCHPTLTTICTADN